MLFIKKLEYPQLTVLRLTSTEKDLLTVFNKIVIIKKVITSHTCF